MTSGRVVLCAFRNVSYILQKTPCHRSPTCKPHLYSSISNFSSLQLNASEKFSSIPHPSQQQAEDDLYKKVVIELKGHDHRVLKSYSAFVHMTAACLQIDECKTYRPPKIIDKLTLNKSAHVYKKHRVQYETRTHFFTFEFFHLTGSTASVFLEYIERNLPEGMAMKVSKHKLEELPEHIRCRPSDGEEESPADTDQTQVTGELYETLIQEQCSENLTEQSEGAHSESEPDREAEVMGDETIQALQQTGQEEVQEVEEEVIERDKASQPQGQTEEKEVLEAEEKTTELDETENLTDTIRSPTDSKDFSNIDSHSSSESDSKLDSGSDSDSSPDSDSDSEPGHGYESDSDSDSDSEPGSSYESDSDSDSESGSDTDLESESDSKPESDSNSKPESDSTPDSDSISDLEIDSDSDRPERS